MVLFSLVLHGITFIFLFLMYQKLQESKEREKLIEQKEREIDGLFQAYLMELRDENQKFTEQLKQLKQASSHQTKPNEPANQDEKSHQRPEPTLEEDLESEPEKEAYSLEELYPPELAYDPIIPEEVEKELVYEPSLESKVLQLHDQGYSADQIAKQLDAGVTEIELMIKFHTQLSN